MGALVTYRLHDSVATITMDDGKVNVLSLAMLTELGAALDRAAADRAVVVLTGRDGVFSAGFDLPVLRAGGAEATDLLRAGFDLAARLLAFPTPVVVACPGHAVAMGVFLVLSGDYRIGASGSYKITANEVAIGLTMPRAAVEICRQRLTPAGFNRAVIIAEVFAPDDAVAAGFLDRLVPAEQLAAAAAAAAADLTRLDLDAHAATKLRARRLAATALREAIDADDAAFRAGLAVQPAG
ncbi:MAG TPA: crotonase/enoyl-CoA hydratase family protein [Streptosporangiaceae bacterium]|nr:crotonase/enoyl-CoA hydratase family protein [Streptosporangiaceae bacterium]